MKKLEGKVAVVTGASSGIGEAAAMGLAKAGARVALVARREDRLKALAERIKKECEGQSLCIVGDVGKYETAENAVKQTMDAWKKIDVLVNNAGVMYLGPVATGAERSFSAPARSN